MTKVPEDETYCILSLSLTKFISRGQRAVRSSSAVSAAERPDRS